MSMYYIARPGEQKQGPFPEATVRANMLHKGQYPQDTLVWCKGMENWQPLHSVFGNPTQAAPPKTPPTLVPKTQTKYFIAERGGKAQGPYTLTSLFALPYRYTENTLVWHKGMAQWEPLKRVPSLALLAAKKGNSPQPPEERTFWQHVFPNVHGRATRTEFIASAFCVAALWMLFLPLLMTLVESFAPMVWNVMSLVCIGLFLLGLVHLFMQAARRLHDIGISAFFLIFFAIPIIGWISFAVTALMPGNKEANAHGPNPRRGSRSIR